MTQTLPTETITLVDSHCHLNFPELFPRLDEVLANAAKAEVRYCLTINTSLEQTDQVIEIAEKAPHLFCTVGVHPNDTINHQGFVDANGASLLAERLSHYAAHPKVVGLGETGLDYYYDTSPKDLQQLCFETHLMASISLNLPVVIHTRNADDDTIALVQRHLGATGVFHCFSGDVDLARKALDLGYYISFSGIITFKTAGVLRDVAKFVPLDRMLVETDSPFLAPIPFRGKPNEPAYTRLVAEKIAEERGVSLAEIATATTDNFFTLFHKAKR